MFGSSLDAELKKAREGAKGSQAIARQGRVLSRWLGVQQKFRDPVASGQVKKQAVASDKTIDSETSSGPVSL